VTGDLVWQNQAAVDALDGTSARMLLGWMIAACWRDQRIQERFAAKLAELGPPRLPVSYRVVMARVHPWTPAERLAVSLSELDAAGRAGVIAKLRREMALRHPQRYRVNADGSVTYIGPRCDDGTEG
jgi:hypothetical protein